MNESPLDLELVRTFVAVVEAGTLAAAGRRLGRSQPATWHRIQALEADLDTPLLERVGRRLVPTAAGRRFAVEGAELLARARAVRTGLRDAATRVAGTVRIGALPTVAAHWMVPALASLLDAHPDVRIDVRFGLVPFLARELREGRVDLVVVVGPAPDGLVGVWLGTTSLAAVLPVGDPAAQGDGPLQPDALRDRRYLGWEGDDPTFSAVAEYARDHGLAGESSSLVPHIETLRELVVAGAGFTILPAYTVARDHAAGRLACRRLVGLEGEVPVQLLTRKRQVVTGAVRAVIDALSADR